MKYYADFCLSIHFFDGDWNFCVRKAFNFIGFSDLQMERVLFAAYFNIPIWRCDFVGVLEIKFLAIRLHDIYDFSNNNCCLLIRKVLDVGNRKISQSSSTDYANYQPYLPSISFFHLISQLYAIYKIDSRENA